MKNLNFKNFNYTMIDSARSGYREVLVTYTVEGKTARKCLFIKEVKGKDKNYYFAEAKKEINASIKDGSLAKSAKKQLGHGAAKPVFITALALALVAGAGVGGYYLNNYLNGGNGGGDLRTFDVKVKSTNCSVEDSKDYSHTFKAGEDVDLKITFDSGYASVNAGASTLKINGKKSLDILNYVVNESDGYHIKIDDIGCNYEFNLSGEYQQSTKFAYAITLDEGCEVYEPAKNMTSGEANEGSIIIIPFIVKDGYIVDKTRSGCYDTKTHEKVRCLFEDSELYPEFPKGIVIFSFKLSTNVSGSIVTIGDTPVEPITDNEAIDFVYNPNTKAVNGEDASVAPIVTFKISLKDNDDAVTIWWDSPSSGTPSGDYQNITHKNLDSDGYFEAKRNMDGVKEGDANIRICGNVGSLSIGRLIRDDDGNPKISPISDGNMSLKSVNLVKNFEEPEKPSFLTLEGGVSYVTVDVGASVTEIPSYAFYNLGGNTAADITSLQKKLAELEKIYDYSFCKATHLFKEGPQEFPFQKLTFAGPHALDDALYQSSSPVAPYFYTKSSDKGLGLNWTNVPVYWGQPSPAQLSKTNDWEYLALNNKNAILTKFIAQTSPTGEFKIPATIEGLNVVQVGDGTNSCFNYSTNHGDITRISVDDSISSPLKIEKKAFFCPTYPWGQLVSLDLTHVSYIGEKAFSDIYNQLFNTITFGNDIVSIGNGAFEGCYYLGQLEFPKDYDTNSKLEYIGDNVFFNDHTLSEKGSHFKLPNSIKHIGNQALTGIADSNIDFAKLTNLEYIGDFAFADNDLTAISIPASVTHIGINPFANLQQPSSASIKVIIVNRENKNYVSNKDNSLLMTKNEEEIVIGGTSENLQIPTTIKKIDDYAFYGQSDLPEQFVVPSNVQSIGNFAFSRTQGIVSLTFGTSESKSKLMSIGDFAFENAILPSKDSTLIIPEAVIKIGEGAFAYDIFNYIKVDPNNIAYTSLVTDESPDGIGAILDYNRTEIVFGCAKTNVNSLPETIERIRSFAFANSSLPSTLDLTKFRSLYEIGESAFMGCRTLTSVSLPATKNEKGIRLCAGAFAGCSSITTELYLYDNLHTIVAPNGNPFPDQLLEVKINTTSGTEIYNETMKLFENWYKGIKITPIGK